MNGLNKSLYGPLVREYFGDVEIVTLDSPRGYMTGKMDIDALVYTAESGSAWTLVYPDYSVVIPQGLSYRVAVGLVLPNRNTDFENFINLWLEVEKTGGLLDKLEKYWIYGVTEKDKSK